MEELRETNLLKCYVQNRDWQRVQGITNSGVIYCSLHVVSYFNLTFHPDWAKRYGLFYREKKREGEIKVSISCMKLFMYNVLHSGPRHCVKIRGFVSIWTVQKKSWTS